MHLSKILVALIALLGAITCFIPWANQQFFGHACSVLGVHFAEGLFCLVYFLLVLGVCWMSSRNKAWSASMANGIAITALLPIALIGYKIIQLQSQAAKMTQYNVDINNYVVYNPAFGMYAALGVVTAIASIVFITVLLQNKSVQLPATWQGKQGVLAHS